MKFALPLLSVPFECFSPESFKAHVRSLFFKPEPVSAKKTLRELKVTAKILKSGLISVVTRREPKYVTESEMKALCEEVGRLENEMFIALRAKGFVVLPSHEEAETIKKNLDEIPF